MAQLTARDWELLSAYLDNQLSSGGREKLEQRLASHLNLQQVLDEMRRTRHLLQIAPRRRAPHNFILTPAMVRPRIEQRMFPFFSWASAAAVVTLVLSVFFRLLPAASLPALTGMTDSAVQPAQEAYRSQENAPAEPGITWGTPPASLVRPPMGGGNPPGMGGGEVPSPKIPAGAAPAPSSQSPGESSPTQNRILPMPTPNPSATQGMSGPKIQAAPPTQTPLPFSFPAAPASQAPTPTPQSGPSGAPGITAPTQAVLEKAIPSKTPGRVNGADQKKSETGVGPVLGLPTSKAGQIIATSPVQRERLESERSMPALDALQKIQISLIAAAVLFGLIAVYLRLRLRA